VSLPLKPNITFAWYISRDRDADIRGRAAVPNFSMPYVQQNTGVAGSDGRSVVATMRRLADFKAHRSSLLAGSKRWPRTLGGFMTVIAMAAGLISGIGQMAPASAQCGPEEASAVWSALAQLPPERVTGRRWASSPLESNYDPCKELSTVLVMIEGGTGSSPIQALMFHHGTFLGTGTWRAYGFTSLNKAASTGDTVVLRYRSGQSCTACDDGLVTTVRYHWDGTKVDMLDPPPPG
jgi:hypothetical protein